MSINRAQTNAPDTLEYATATATVAACAAWRRSLWRRYKMGTMIAIVWVFFAIQIVSEIIATVSRYHDDEWMRSVFLIVHFFAVLAVVVFGSIAGFFMKMSIVTMIIWYFGLFVDVFAIILAARLSRRRRNEMAPAPMSPAGKVLEVLKKGLS